MKGDEKNVKNGDVWGVMYVTVYELCPFFVYLRVKVESNDFALIIIHTCR